MYKLTLGIASLPPDLSFFVNEAKILAESLGPYPLPRGRVSIDEAQAVVTAGRVNLGIQVQRDPSAQRAIAAHLVEVMGEALLNQYDITNPAMERALLNIAVLMHTNNYTPMRVLGATSEAFRR